ncbi:hypothetical protein N7507_001711 [Penicillium longicatenatum]|nr:hypothetical protein N7507_001711 [Penicillium longicatenatum]
MPFVSLPSEEVLSEGIRIMQAGLESAKTAAAYSKPVLDKSVNLTAEAFTWSAQNPALAACAVVGTTGAIMVAAPGLATAPVLSIIGFGNGIQASSLAAAAHSTIGNIGAGSMMAIAQSAGAGGSGLAVINGVAQLGGVAMTAGASTLAWIKARL